MLSFTDVAVIHNALVKQRERQDEGLDYAINMGHPRKYIKSLKKDLEDTNNAIRKIRRLQIVMEESAY